MWGHQEYVPEEQEERIGARCRATHHTYKHEGNTEAVQHERFTFCTGVGDEWDPAGVTW